MIEFLTDDTNPLEYGGITCFRKDSSVTVTEDQPTVDYCFCSFECEEVLLQFAGDTAREKDHFMLYGKSLDPSYSQSFFINGIEIVDETYGKEVPNGFEVDFTKVYAELGSIELTLKKVYTEWGIEKTESWGKFKAVPYNVMRADQTVKIEAYQTGSLQKSYDFENENVRFSLRIPGTLTNKQMITELLDTPDENWNDVQVHDRFWYEYDLIFDSNRYNFVKLFLENMAFGTRLLISDYSLVNQHKKEPFYRIPLRLSEVDSPHIKGTNTTNYTIKLRDALRDGIKHPFENC